MRIFNKIHQQVAGKVSVVIPLYNHERYIAQAIESVLNQSAPVHELIIVDDGSHDASPKIAAQYAAADDRVIFWTQPNRGAHVAINEGMAKASGDFVAILNSDDYYAPGRIAKILAAFNADPSVDMVVSDLRFADASDKSIKNDWYAGVERYRRSSSFLDLSLINGNFVMTTSNFVMRQSVLSELGGFAPLRYAHDLEFLLRLLLGGKKIKIVNDCLLTYRLHPSNTIKEGQLKVKTEWALVIANYLDQLSVSGRETSAEWMKALMAILQKHPLHDSVLVALLALRNSKYSDVERNFVLGDESLRNAVAVVVT